MILIYAFSNQWGTNISRRTLLDLQKIINNKTSPFLQGEMSQSDRGVLNSRERSGVDFELIYFHPRQFFEKYIKNSNYDLIIGLGDLYGNFNKIKIETQAKNSYNNQSIYPFSPIFIDLNLPTIDNFDSNYFVISSQMGTYNCNWIAYSTQLYLNQKQLSTKHLFLHLPKKASASNLAHQIHSLFELNQMLQ